jgi:DUF1680 family protein
VTVTEKLFLPCRSVGRLLVVDFRHGPVRLGPGAHAALRPLDGARIDGGFWARRQHANRQVSLPDGAEQLERAGNLHNLRLAAGTATGDYRNDLPFMDSDVYKWLEAAGWELGRSPEPALAKAAAQVIDVLAAAQRDDGYLDSYYQVVRPDKHFEELAWGHELYCAGHLIQAAVGYVRATGERRPLDVARRLADHVDAEFGPGRNEGVCGHPEIETALVELYRETGEPRYLALARSFVDRRGTGSFAGERFGAAYFQDHVPVVDAREVAGHAVRQLYLNAGVTDLVLETGDERLRASMLRQWDDMVATKTYLTGGLGAHHQDEAFGDSYELPGERAYCETCAAIASVQWSWRLLLLTGEARYADLIERTLYNGFAAGVALDGRTYFYVNPLQVRDDHPDGTRRTPWYKCACCPPNIMRLLASLQHYLATVDGTGIQLHQYAAGTLRTDRVGLRVGTDYPHDGTVRITVDDAPGEGWALSLRVPQWCRTASVAVNGVPVPARPDGGYLRLHRDWRAGDTVTLELDMPVRVTAGDPRVDAIRSCVALERGPLVYCLEGTDQPAGVRLDDVALPPGAPARAEWRPGLLEGVNAITATGWHRDRAAGGGWWPYPAASAAGHGAAGTPVTLTAVPYYAWANRDPGPMRVWIPNSGAVER